MTRLDVFGDTSVAVSSLAQTDPALSYAAAQIGAPHIRRRPGGFAALFRIIVEQQVSVQSAQAIWARCVNAFDPFTPQSVMAVGEAALRACGLSRPKCRYVLSLAAAFAHGDIDADAISALDDVGAMKILQALKGVGPWSAAIYLLFCEGRPDIWPPGDVALLGAYRAARVGARRHRGPVTTLAGLDRKSAAWSPYRGVAAHILWTYYAHIRGRAPI